MIMMIFVVTIYTLLWVTVLWMILFDSEEVKNMGRDI
jgi:hypothetical protein